MSQDQAKKFLEQLNEDKELQQKYQACFSAEGESTQATVEGVIAKVVKVAKENGFEFSETEAMTIYSDSEKEEELSEEDLEQVAGGKRSVEDDKYNTNGLTLHSRDDRKQKGHMKEPGGWNPNLSGFRGF
jgi:predicted ribosomally synthesized peptide with nif11-like leader